MPGDLVKEVFLVVHGDLALSGRRLGEALAGGDEHLVLGVPVGPGIVRNDDLGHKLERDPVERDVDRQAFHDLDFSLGQAVGLLQPGEGVGHHGVVLDTADGHHVIDPVGAGNGVPRLGHDAGHGNGHRSADLVLAPQRLGPQPRAIDGAREVAGEHDIGRVRGNTDVVLQPDALRVLKRQLEGASHQLGALLHACEVIVVQLGRNVIELVRGRVRLPRREGQAIGRVEEAKVAARVAADGG